MKLAKLLDDLSLKRPIFHSEADFQHALAWEIHTHYPDAKIRLEYRPAKMNAKMYIDLWVVLANGSIWAIELKYKTRKLEIDIDDEEYRLLNQSAQDVSRYDFLRDVVRLELITATRPEIRGVAVLLTNDNSYWSIATRSGSTVDEAFRIHEGRSLTGSLTWSIGASPGTKRGREPPIGLAATYNMVWTAYSKVNAERHGIFRYTLLDITGGTPKPQI